MADGWLSDINLSKKELFRPEEAAKYLQISVKTIYTLISEGKIPAVRIYPTKLIRIKRETIQNMLQEINI